jgi:hypothetical protein
MFEEMSIQQIGLFLGLMYLLWSEVQIKRNIRKQEDEIYDLRIKVNDLELEKKKIRIF